MTPTEVDSSLVGVRDRLMEKLLPGKTWRSFFMDPAIQNFILVYPPDASNMNRKVKSGKNLSLFRSDKAHHLQGDGHV